MKSKGTTVTTLYQMKKEGTPITALTAYDFPFAKIADDAGVNIILVGDSAAMVVQGEATTLPITMDEMLYHTRLVAKACTNAMVIGDMPFMSYQTSVTEAIHNAGRFLKEAGAAAIKLEGGASVSNRIKAISDAGIPVQAHIGLTPQSVHQMGGFKVQRNEDKLIADALEVQNAGAFSVVLEGIPSEISRKISQELEIPTIGIGAGPECDGQILVLHDVIGLNFNEHLPKFVKQYAQVKDTTREAIQAYITDVKEKRFPGKEHCY